MIRRIFINYRHDDSPGTAGRICDHLKDALGPDSLFIDDDIPKGEDFEKYLNTQLNGSFVFLAIIGRNWLHVLDKEGHRRLDTDGDWVRVEIATALVRQIKVIPVILDGAVVPDASDLPSDLRPLANRQAITLRNHQFDLDFAALVETLREALGADQLNGGGANGSTANNVPSSSRPRNFKNWCTAT
jgi:TIR domain